MRDLSRRANHQREALDVPDGLLLHIGHLRGLALSSGLPLAARAVAGVVAAAVTVARTTPILACLVLPILRTPIRQTQVPTERLLKASMTCCCMYIMSMG